MMRLVPRRRPKPPTPLDAIDRVLTTTSVPSQVVWSEVPASTADSPGVPEPTGDEAEEEEEEDAE